MPHSFGGSRTFHSRTSAPAPQPVGAFSLCQKLAREMITQSNCARGGEQVTSIINSLSLGLLLLCLVLFFTRTNLLRSVLRRWPAASVWERVCGHSLQQARSYQLTRLAGLKGGGADRAEVAFYGHLKLSGSPSLGTK